MSSKRPVIDHFADEFAFLSNFYESWVEYEGAKYPTVEHAYQAAKTVIPEERETVRKASTPGKAKKLGQKVTKRDHWDDGLKVDVMFYLLIQKFGKHPELRDALLATGDALLIEGNTWNDTFWGVCYGKGRNELGRLLMQVRRMLQTEKEHNERPT